MDVGLGFFFFFWPRSGGAGPTRQMRGSTLSFWSRFYVGRSHPGWLPVLSLISQKFRISISLLGQLADKDSSFPEDRAAPRGRVEIVSVCERLTQWNVRARVCLCYVQAFWLSLYLHVSWAERELPTNVSLSCFTGPFLPSASLAHSIVF